MFTIPTGVWSTPGLRCVGQDIRFSAMEARNRANQGFLARLDKLPVLPWKSAKTGQIDALMRDLELRVVKIEKGEGA